jgi:hypothetical protein
MLRPVYVPLRGEGSHPERARSRTARNIMQRGPPCEEDPALPVLFTLINNSENALAIFRVF